MLFAISCAVHAVQQLRYKAWFFTPLTLACLLEAVGYIFRSLSSKDNPYNIIWFVIQYFLIVVAPVFISASIYVCINKLITWAKSYGFAADRWWLAPKVILWGFVTVDVLTMIMQIAGAALIGSSQSNQKDPTTGNNILLAGLAIQSLSFTAFLMVLALFRLALVKDRSLPSTIRTKDMLVSKIKPWFILALAVASILVYLRTLFRLAETAEGLFASISTNEVFFGTLEFAPVVLAVWIMAIWHPGRWLPVVKATGLRDSSTAALATTSEKENPISNA